MSTKEGSLRRPLFFWTCSAIAQASKENWRYTHFYVDAYKHGAYHGMMTATEFRDTIRDLGISQRALAERLGLAISTVNRWAVGHADVPQYAIAFLEERRKLHEIEKS